MSVPDMPVTENFLLRKPRYGDPADVADINYNTDIIDTTMSDNRKMIADAYSNAQGVTYDVGDIREYLGKTYECIAPTSGNWDSTKWVRKSLGQIIEEHGSGGVSSLSDLDDVSLTTPTEGQILTYDGDDWVNADAPDVDVTKTASGNPIEVSDSANAPLVKCVTQIQGSQDLHGYDKPWVGGAGKNKVESIQSLNIGSDGELISFTGFKSPIAKIESGKTYVFSINGVATIPQTYAFYSSFPTTGSISYDGTRVIPSGYTFTAPIDGYIVARYADSVDDRIQIEEGSTATSYEPYSNICPITAYTEGKIEVRGKNLLNPTEISQPSGNNIVWGYYDNGILLKVGYTYTLSINTDISSISFYATDHTTQLAHASTAGVRSVSYTPANDIHACLRVYKNTGLTVDTVKSSWMLERGSVATTYEPYKGTTHTTTYPSAIYRGSEDVVKGEVTSDMPVIDLGDLTWSAYTTDTTGHSFYVNVPTGTKPVSSDSSVANLVCEIYETVAFINPSEWLRRNAIICQVPNAQRWIVRDERYSDATSFASAMSGIKLAYELATPTTSSVTPTNLPIRTLSGYNHIESSTGEMEVEYITEGYQPLVDLIQSNQHVYSTQEQVVGTWVDGKTLYEKTVVNTSDITIANDWITIDSSPWISSIETLVSGTMKRNQSCASCFAEFNLYNGSIRASTPNLSTVFAAGGSYTIRYTKTTQTSSLNAPLTSQKAQIEPLTTKDEEVPIEVEESEIEPIKDVSDENDVKANATETIEEDANEDEGDN